MGWDEWCSRYITESIPLFEVDSENAVKTLVKGNKAFLTRNKAVDDLIFAQIEKMDLNPESYEGIIAFMYWKVKEEFIPLHVTAIAIESKSNLKPGTLARWGYTANRIFGILVKPIFKV